MEFDDTVRPLLEDRFAIHEEITDERLIRSYIPIYGMVKTIRVSESFHGWVEAHNREGETMEETLRRLTRGPHPSEVADVLSAEQVDEVEDAIEELNERKSRRLRDVRNEFTGESDEE